MFDWQSCKLIGITKPASDNEDISSAEDLISYCARVSNPHNQKNFDTSSKLLKYLIRNEHWSPFEMVSVCIEINTTRDIGRQILRHRSFSFQEFSQRYADPTGDLGFTTREFRLQDITNRQNSIEIDDSTEDNRFLKAQWLDKQEQILDIVNDSYQWAIDNGIAKEQARSILPEGLTNSRMYMHGTLRSWIHYCLLRTGNGTQKEHRDIATKCWNILCNEFDFLKDIEVEGNNNV